MISDLQDSFNFFDKDNIGLISQKSFESIIYNFGFRLISIKDKNDELMRADPKFFDRTGFDFNFLKTVVNYRWNKGGGSNLEARAAFKVFDKRERNVIGISEFKQVFGDYLDHPVSDADLAELMAACDRNGTGQISPVEFK